MAHTLVDLLKRKLDHIRSERWADRTAPSIQLTRDSGEGEGGALRGALQVYMRTATGAEKLLHEERLDGISSETALDDCLARVLSLVLHGHPQWPR